MNWIDYALFYVFGMPFYICLSCFYLDGILKVRCTDESFHRLVKSALIWPLAILYVLITHPYKWLGSKK